MAKNAHTHGGGKWSTRPTWTGVRARISIKSYVSNIAFGCCRNPPGFWTGRAAKRAHNLQLAQIAPMVALVCQIQEELLAKSKI